MANNKSGRENMIKYIGVNDHKIDLFEGQYIVPNGMAYNSYVVLDEKIAIMDSVDGRFGGLWLENIDATLEGKAPDYLVVHHVEPDHSGSIVAFMERYENAKIVTSQRGLGMINAFYGKDYLQRSVVVGDKDTLQLGKGELTFFSAPMVHWPEVMVSYLNTEKALFSADAFGKFGALDIEDDWACEARRYYFGIVGKYGAQVQALLKKLEGVEIEGIYPLHGPALRENLGYYLDLYNTWSSYKPEKEGVLIAYTSVYGNTEKAVMILKDMLLDRGLYEVSTCDLAREDIHEAIEDAFKYDRLVLATTTYNGDIFPYMKEFINHLTERNYQNRTVALIENGSWAPLAKKKMASMLEDSKNLTILDTGVTILSSISKENLSQIKALAKELCK
ncbi:MAG: FprA family A-type flavoprotein [Clostridia bacterium]|nr:FprA family A-type flavoprotein [Clostridia bacterium]